MSSGNKKSTTNTANNTASVKKRKKATASFVKKGAKKGNQVRKEKSTIKAENVDQFDIIIFSVNFILSVVSCLQFLLKTFIEAKDKEFHNSKTDNGNNSSSDEDYSDDDDEGDEGYKPGGYHPVVVGDKFNSRYVIIEKLGWGHFSTVWTSLDKKRSSIDHNEFVALKIQKSASHYREAAMDEIELLNCVNKTAASVRSITNDVNFDPCVVTLVDHFDHVGPNGKHVCMAFERLGENLLKVIKRYNYRGIPLPIVKNFVRQICQGLDFLHRHCHIIHTDLKPENILIANSANIINNSLVKSILTADGTKTSSKKHKNKSDSKNASYENSNMIDENQKQLSADQRKKLKKKLKKKRQMARKNEMKKNRHRRKSAHAINESNIATEKRPISIEKVTATMEMLMMERESIPIVERINNNDVEIDALLLPLLKSNPSLIATSQTSAIHNNNFKYVTDVDNIDHTLNYCADSKDDFKAEIMDKDKSDKLQPSVPIDSHSNRNSSYSNINEQLNFMDDDNDTDLYNRQLPPWLRPTLLAYFNFQLQPSIINYDFDVANPKTTALPVAYGNAQSIPPSEFIPPSSILYAKISMVLPIEKLKAVFGPPFVIDPNATDDAIPNIYEDEEMYYSDWYLRLRPLSLSSGNLSPKQSQDDLYGNSMSPAPSPERPFQSFEEQSPSLHFLIKAVGEDTEFLTGLSSYCLFDSIVSNPSKYSIKIPNEKLILFDIIHNASITEHLVAYLEQVIPGLRFFVHYDLPDVVVEEEDADMLYFAKKSCLHPICQYDPSDPLYDMEGSLERQMEEKINPQGRGVGLLRAVESTDYGYEQIMDKFKPGQGALFGLDI
eukprot:gene6518-8958_t